MKKIGLILAILCLVVAVGTAFGDEYTDTKAWGSNPDSLIYYLDPSNAPAPQVLHTGLMGLNEEGLPGARGSAAGGAGEIRDSLVNYLDPEFVPAAVKFPKKSATVDFMRYEPDSLTHQISPIE
jgi:hypothetical protein